MSELVLQSGVIISELFPPQVSRLHTDADWRVMAAACGYSFPRQDQHNVTSVPGVIPYKLFHHNIVMWEVCK